MTRWKKISVAIGAVICLFAIGAAVYNAYAVTTFEQAMGLPEDKIVKVAIIKSDWEPPHEVETTDKTKIHALLAQLDSQKFLIYPFLVRAASGFDYYIQIYSSDDSWKRYTLVTGVDRHGSFGYWGDFAGSKLEGHWDPENSTAVHRILDSFYVAWGDQVSIYNDG